MTNRKVREQIRLREEHIAKQEWAKLKNQIRVKGHKLTEIYSYHSVSRKTHAVCECGWSGNFRSRERAREAHREHKVSLAVLRVVEESHGNRDSTCEQSSGCVFHDLNVPCRKETCPICRQAPQKQFPVKVTEELTEIANALAAGLDRKLAVARLRGLRYKIAQVEQSPAALVE